MDIVRIVNSVFSSNTFVLTGLDDKGVYLVDIGDYDKLREILPVGQSIRAVFLTHTHYDHIYGLPKLLEKFPHCKIYTSIAGIEGLASSRLNFSRYHGNVIEIKGNNIYSLKDGDRLYFPDGEELEVYETPGHDRSCLSYRLGNRFFSGDSFIPEIKVISSFRNSNKQDAEKSLIRILYMVKGLDLYPGHGEIYKSFQPELK